MRPESGLGISIVCVYNDPEVRISCLDTSIARYTGTVDVDYVPVDNTEHVFVSAGAALNHGARLARHEVVLFVHQDVYLHSIDRLAEVGAELAGERWGILGASGALTEGGNLGRMRDRLQFSGGRAHDPAEVESLDEVAFMVRRDRVLAEPLSTDPDLAWHAYAVEYGLRMRRRGLAVGAVDLAVTHNSLTINLDRFAQSHARLAVLYPELLPVRTTCGTIRTPGRSWREAPLIRRHGWRYRWLKKSLLAARARRHLDARVILSDIRDDVDLLDFDDESPLHLINLDREGGFVEYAGDRADLTLTRYGKPVRMRAVSSVTDVVASLRELPRHASVLVADLEMDDLRVLGPQLDRADSWLIGLQNGACWLLGGQAARALPAQWTDVRAVPLRGSALVGSR